MKNELNYNYITEEWKPVEIEGFPGYKVSSFGRVRNKQNKILKPQIAPNGYSRVALWSHGKQKPVSVHRLVALAFIDNPNDYPCVNHIDGNKTNNNVNNLEWCTYSQNTRHALETGLMTPRERALKGKRLEDVRKGYSSGISARELAKKYGVDRTTIFEAVKDLPKHKPNYTGTPIVDEIRLRYLEGMGVRELERMFNIDHSTISRFVKDMPRHSKCRKGILTEDNKKEIRRLRNGGMTINAIAQRFDVHSSTIQYHLNKNNE